MSGRRGRWVMLGLLAVALVVLPLSAAPSIAAWQRASGAVPAAGGLVVRVQSGLVRGVNRQAMDNFLGIPYARPPVGALRWMAPQPPLPWQGVRSAADYGNRCAAPASTNGPRSEAEDCLYLNVQRPPGTRPGARLPVLFWIHGGSLFNGSAKQHDGGLLVRTTGIIVVTMNYRLGVFGFLAHPALTAEAAQSGNYGFEDQQAALAWVHRNIAAFGGDPQQVTVGGESAGAQSVCMHLVAPGSRGLFARAIVESGSCTSESLPAAEAEGVTFARQLGCTGDRAAICLRGKTPAQLLNATQPTAVHFVSGVPVLPQVPDTAVRGGSFARVPVLMGATLDEGRTFTKDFIGYTRAQYQSVVRALYPARAAAILARYPWPKRGASRFTAAYLLGAIFTDSGLIVGIGGCGNRSLTRAVARYTRVFAYEFDNRDGPGLSPQPAGYVWGAGHAAELAYLWPSFDNGTPIAPTFTPAQQRLAMDMVRYWGSFIGGVAARPLADPSVPWPPYTGTGLSLSLRPGGRSAVVTDETLTTEHNCDLWPQAS